MGNVQQPGCPRLSRPLLRLETMAPHRSPSRRRKAVQRSPPLAPRGRDPPRPSGGWATLRRRRPNWMARASHKCSPNLPEVAHGASPRRGPALPTTSLASAKDGLRSTRHCALQAISIRRMLPPNPQRVGRHHCGEKPRAPRDCAVATGAAIPSQSPPRAQAEGHLRQPRFGDRPHRVQVRTSTAPEATASRNLTCTQQTLPTAGRSWASALAVETRIPSP
mmetsp:Transcript_103805/g.292797  ORF Transcript_103805/g.292797 Transcript_103805/m.292797 type:complete len:221 (+) Transcript_103805:1536-2198(+)